MQEQNKKKPRENLEEPEGYSNTQEQQECNEDTKEGQGNVSEEETEKIVEASGSSIKYIGHKVCVPEKDYERIQDEFASWIAVPEEMREELGLPTQSVFAEKYEVSTETLRLWKQNPEFWEKVKLVRGYWLKEQTTGVMKALVKKAKREGSASEVKLFMQIAEDFQEKNQIQVMPLSGVLAEIKQTNKNIISKPIEKLDGEKLVIPRNEGTNQKISGGQEMEIESSLLDKR